MARAVITHAHAGHVLGSAQVRIEHHGLVWVASGDYFASGDADDANPTCTPFEPVRCHCFITESTFGLPVYRWRPQREVFAEIDAWWATNATAGRSSLLLGYSFGKAQRLLAGVDPAIGPIVVHGAVEPLNEAYRGFVLSDHADQYPDNCCRRIDWLNRASSRLKASPSAQDATCSGTT